MSDPAADEPATFLESLSPDLRDSLFEIGHRRRFPRGTALFVENDPAHETLVVVDGLVKAVAPNLNGRDVILNVHGPGTLLGEVAALDGGRRSATVESLSEVEVLVVPRSVFDQFLLDHPTVLRSLALVLTRRLRYADRRQVEFGTGDSLQRLCARLVELAERYGEPDARGVVQVVSPLNQTDLASWSGLSREAVVKSLKTLRDLGWIENRGRTIALIEMAQIRIRAGL